MENRMRFKHFLPALLSVLLLAAWPGAGRADVW
jgi:hypothetical protein